MVEAFLTPPFQILDFIDKELVRLDQDLDPIVVNILTKLSMLPLQLFRNITNFLSQNVIVVIDLTEVVLYFVFLDNLIVKNK